MSDVIGPIGPTGPPPKAAAAGASANASGGRDEKKSSKKEKKEKKPKKTKKEFMAEMRELDRQTKVNPGVNYAQVADRHLDDQRFEREKAFADKMNKDIAEGKMVDEETTGQSATFDAFMRMQTGQAERTITDKINDKNRPTWDQYKKDNEDKLDLKGAELKKMQAYRAELDQVRDENLARIIEAKGPKVKSDNAISDDEDNDGGSKDSDGDGDSDSSSGGKKKKKKKKKKHKKEKKRKRSSDSSGEEDNGDGDGDGEEDEEEDEEKKAKKEKKKAKKEKKKAKKESKKKAKKESEGGGEKEGEQPVKLSDFLRGGGGSDSDSD